MSESSGAQDASTLVLRISVPAGDGFDVIVKELAARVAVYVGDPDPAGTAAVGALTGLLAKVTHGHAQADVVVEFRRTEEDLLIQAQSAGRSAETRRPLPL